MKSNLSLLVTITLLYGRLKGPFINFDSLVKKFNLSKMSERLLFKKIMYEVRPSHQITFIN